MTHCPQYAHARCPGCECVCHGARDRVLATRTPRIPRHAVAVMTNAWGTESVVEDQDGESLTGDRVFPDMDHAEEWAEGFNTAMRGV